MATKTRTIAGHQITLTTGVRYRAERPIADGRVDASKVFPVTLRALDADEPDVVLGPMSYYSANNLLEAFNNGACSFDGRVW